MKGFAEFEGFCAVRGAESNSVGSDCECLRAAVLDVGPALPSMGRDIHGEFEAAPDPEFVKDASQVVLDDLLAGADDSADLAIGHAFPDQD